MIAVGIDGTRSGWVAVALRDGGFEAASTSTLAALVEGHPDAASIGVDIPIGLAQTGWRACDLAARKLLGARWPSVFLTPVAAALDVAERPPSVSAQAWNLIAKIREAAAVADARLREVHPEVAFAAMAGGPLRHPKKTWDGQGERLELLHANGIDLPRLLKLGTGVAPDDVIDAAAAAWTAARIAAGTAQSVGDEVGRIWY